MARLRPVGLDHLQAGAGKDLFRVHAWRFSPVSFDVWSFDAWSFDAWSFDAWNFDVRRFLADGFFHPGSRRGRRLMMDCRFRLQRHGGLALLLQAMLFQLLRVHRLIRTLRMRLLRTAFALRPLAAVRTFCTLCTFRPIATVCAAAPATAAAVTAPAARFFAFLLRGPCLSVLLALRSARLLGRTGRTLVRPALALRAFELGKLALLRHLSLLAFAVRAIRPGLLLLRALIAARLLIAALVIAPTVASLALLVASAVAAVALMITPAVAAPVAASASLTSLTSATLAAALLVAVAMLVARAFRSGRTDGRLIGRRRLCDGFLRLEPAEQAAEKT